jgi:hypothetical protein
MKRACFFCLFSCLISTFVLSQSGASSAELKARARVLDQFGTLPLSFEANQGQTDSRVKFFSRTSEFTLFLTADQAVLALDGSTTSEGRPQAPNSFLKNSCRARPLPSAAEAVIGDKAFIAAVNRCAIRKQEQGRVFQQTVKPASLAGSDRATSLMPSVRKPQDVGHPDYLGGVLRMKLRGANPASRVSGVEELPGTNNYFIGKDPAKWRTNVPTYAKVRYDGIYSGIDLVYYGSRSQGDRSQAGGSQGNQGQLEYDFIVAPGADARRIAFDITGAKGISTDARGELVFKVGYGNRVGQREQRLRRGDCGQWLSDHEGRAAEDLRLWEA